MNKQDLKQLIQEEISKILNETMVKQFRIYLDRDYDRYYGDFDDRNEAIISAKGMDSGRSYVEIYDIETDKVIWSNQQSTPINEEYQDQYRFRGRLVTNIKSRPQKEILSDIRSIAGVTVVSTQELQDYNDQSFKHFNTVLNLKIDGYPYIKQGGFNRETINKIADDIRKVPDVLSFSFNPDSIESMKP
jgi:hypothetical protein